MIKRKPGRPREGISRDHLVALARSRFAACGYEGTSLQDLAEDGGLTKASLLHHFGSKERLYTEVMGDLVSRMASLLPPIVTPGGFLGALDALGDALGSFLAADPTASKLLMREVVGGGPFARGPGFGAVEAALLATAAFLREGMRQGVVAEQDDRQLALSIISLHIVWWAAPELSRVAAGVDPFSTRAIDTRKESVRIQVRRLVGASISE